MNGLFEGPMGPDALGLSLCISMAGVLLTLQKGPLQQQSPRNGGRVLFVPSCPYPLGEKRCSPVKQVGDPVMGIK